MNDAHHEPSKRKAVIIGAGPVGCLTAISFAKTLGWDVEIYEARPDMRLPAAKAVAQQRSINLAISSRGLAALQTIDPAATSRFLETVVPMRGRMIHDPHGHQVSQLYDPTGQCINSIDRALLNEGLLNEALSQPNIRIFFKHKVQSVDFDNRTLLVYDQDADKSLPVHFDLCVGTDGTYSIIRRQLMRLVRMDYQQQYIPHEYLELKMPAGQDDDGKPRFLLDPNHLHIWPRHSFMLIALPNQDKTFTCTLFAPSEDFDALFNEEKIISWFNLHFPDALALIGKDSLLDAFARNPRSPLMTLKVNPYHYKDRAIILGDAAHSMVPFYGQGLNCGLEDVRVLTILLREAGIESTVSSSDGDDPRLAAALTRYTETRHADLEAICDLAMDNFLEMRHLVTTPLFLLRKAVDNLLFSLSSHSPVTWSTLSPVLSRIPFPTSRPGGWLPLYTMVTFRPDISYATAREKAKQQSQLLANAAVLGSLTLGAASLFTAWMALYHRTRGH